MSTNQPAIGWTLDPTRNKYYYFNVAEQAYVYQDGERIQLNANPGTTAQTTSTGNNGYVMFLPCILDLNLIVSVGRTTPAREFRALQF